MVNHPLRLHVSVLTLAMLTCGTLSMLFGKELGWDLANYHYYNPYAILHARAHIDFWPSSFVHQYINPTIDFLSYFLINYFSPRMTVFILGAIHGINYWLLFMIANLFISTRLALCVALLGMYGPAALSGIGSFQNDDLVSIFVLGFVFFALLSLQRVTRRYVSTSAGLLLGIAIGLKLTAGLFFIGASLATLLLPLSRLDRVKLLSLMTISVIIGMLLSSGYWMYLMWVQHHNPLFPFFNHIFKSPDFAITNWRDTRFLPHGVWQHILFPFYFSWDGRTADGGFRDLRFAIVYVLFILAGVRWIYKRFFGAKHINSDFKQEWLFAFFIFSYIAWQYYFSIARYLVPLEMLAPLVIYLLLKQMPMPSYAQTAILILIFYTLFFFMTPIPVARAPWYEAHFFNVKLPPSVTKTPDAMVLIAYSVYLNGKPWLDANPRPQAYLIPYFPPRWRFVGVPFGHEKYLEDPMLNEKLHKLIQTYPHNIYLLTSDVNMPELYRVAQYIGLVQAGMCEKIFSDRQKLTQQNVLLCPVRHANYSILFPPSSS